MSQKALFFIPDISGFSEFVHNTDIIHSRHIMSELLEDLLENNILKLELAEIEGDALFLYKTKNIPTLDLIFKQVRVMFIALQKQLKRYQYERICHCGACSSTENLSLKFIVHYGDVEFIKVKKSVKPFGSDVIKAHRLLKNQIPIDEYVLFTQSVFSFENNSQDSFDFLKSAIAGKETYDFGEIDYFYLPLGELKKDVPYVPPIPVDIPQHKLVYEEELIETDCLSLYEVISNFKYRKLWNKHIKQLDYDESRLNRVGTQHQCIVGRGKKLMPVTIKKQVEPKQLVYGERIKEIPFVKNLHIYFVLEEAGQKKTRLIAEVYADFTIFGQIFKFAVTTVFKKTIRENLKEIKNLIESGFVLES